MKKTLLFLLLLIVGFGVWFLLRKEPQTPAPLPTTAINQPASQQPENNLIVAVPNKNTTALSSSTAAQTNEAFNALTATNLEQWKASVKNLVQLGGFQFNQDWIFEQQKPSGKGSDRNSGIQIILNQNGKAISYVTTFINLSTKNGSDSDLLEMELYSPNMDIEQTRKLGLQLCDMLQVDPKNFLVWCGKVGTNWLDQPLFADGNRHYSFHLIQSFDKEKPWCIDFMIIPNP